MKTKLLGVVAPCILALVGTANASTFRVSGQFENFTGTVNGPNYQGTYFWFEVPNFPIPSTLSTPSTLSKKEKIIFLT